MAEGGTAAQGLINLEDEGRTGDGGGSSKTVEVRGFSLDTSHDVLEMYFENTRRSGGGDIEEFEIEDDVAYITFEEAEVVQRVVSHSPHQVVGQTLSVTEFCPPPQKACYKNRVLIQRLNSAITEEQLTNFLETETGMKVTEFLYGEEEGKVVVTFSNCIDVSALRKGCRTRKLQGTFLQVTKVAISNFIFVKDLKPSASHDVILFYFENKRRSGGGVVERVEMNIAERYCLVYFEDHNAIDTVLCQQHKIDGNDLEVHLHHECLGRRSSRNRLDPFLGMSKPELKENLVVSSSICGNPDIGCDFVETPLKAKTSSSNSSNPDAGCNFVETPKWQEDDGKNCVLPLWIKYKRASERTIVKDIKKIPCSWDFHLFWNFFTKTKQGQNMLDDILKKYGCSVTVSSDDDDLFIFKISEESFETKSDLIDFIKDTLGNVYTCAQQSLFSDIFLVDHRMLEDILQRVKQTKEMDNAWIELVGQQEPDAMCVVCTEENKVSVLQLVAAINVAVQDCFENHEEVVTIEPMWQKVLTKFGYLQQMSEKFPNLTITHDETKSAILLKDARDQSKAAADHLMELLGIAQSEVKKVIFSPGCQFEIFTYPEMCSYIDNSIIKLPIVCIPNHLTKKLHLFSKTLDEIIGMDKFIKGCIKERPYLLTKDQSECCPKIVSSLEELKKKYNGKIVINQSSTGIILTTTDDIFESVDAVVQEIIRIETGKVQLVENHDKRDEQSVSKVDHKTGGKQRKTEGLLQSDKDVTKDFKVLRSEPGGNIGHLQGTIQPEVKAKSSSDGSDKLEYRKESGSRQFDELFDSEESLEKFTEDMVKQFMKEEELIAQHQFAVLRLREKALLEKTKAELAWLEQQKERLRNKGADDQYPIIVKKQRGLKMKLQDQQAELKHLRDANEARWLERQMILLQQGEKARQKKAKQIDEASDAEKRKRISKKEASAAQDATIISEVLTTAKDSSHQSANKRESPDVETVSRSESSPDERQKITAKDESSRSKTYCRSGNERSIAEEIQSQSSMEDVTSGKERKLNDSSDDTHGNETFEQETATVTVTKEKSVKPPRSPLEKLHGLKFRELSSPHSPFSNKGCNLESESEDAISHTETQSDMSDFEGCVLALNEELLKYKKEADRLKSERKRKRKETMKSKEESLKKQIEAYDNQISQLKAELQKEMEREPVETSVCPQIKQPKVNPPKSLKKQGDTAPKQQGDTTPRWQNDLEGSRSDTDSTQSSPSVIEEKEKERKEELMGAVGGATRGDEVPLRHFLHDEYDDFIPHSQDVIESVERQPLVQKVAAGPPAPSFKGVSETEVKYRFADPPVLKNDSLRKEKKRQQKRSELAERKEELMGAVGGATRGDEVPLRHFLHDEYDDFIPHSQDVIESVERQPLVQKVAAGPPAPSFKGVSETEVKYRFADPPVLKNDSRHKEKKRQLSVKLQEKRSELAERKEELMGAVGGATRGDEVPLRHFLHDEYDDFIPHSQDVIESVERQPLVQDVAAVPPAPSFKGVSETEVKYHFADPPVLKNDSRHKEKKRQLSVKLQEKRSELAERKEELMGAVGAATRGDEVPLGHLLHDEYDDFIPHSQDVIESVERQPLVRKLAAGPPAPTFIGVSETEVKYRFADRPLLRYDTCHKEKKCQLSVKLQEKRSELAERKEELMGAVGGATRGDEVPLRHFLHDEYDDFIPHSQDVIESVERQPLFRKLAAGPPAPSFKERKEELMGAVGGATRGDEVPLRHFLHDEYDDFIPHSQDVIESVERQPLVQKVAAGPPAPSFKGFSETEVKYRFADQPVLKYDSCHKGKKLQLSVKLHKKRSELADRRKAPGMYLQTTQEGTSWDTYGQVPLHFFAFDSRPLRAGNHGVNRISPNHQDSLDLRDLETGSELMARQFRSMSVPNEDSLLSKMDQQVSLTHPSQVILGYPIQETSFPENEFPCYKMNARPRGICLIISNREFVNVPHDAQGEHLGSRDGTEIDLEKLANMFKRLHFIVEKRENLKDDEMTRALMDIACTDHEKFDCFVCCILSHGAQGKVYGSNGITVEIGHLTSFVQPNSCPTLRDKPKVFFIQACQGPQTDQGFQIEADALVHRESRTQLIPNEADFLLGYSTVSGYISYRVPRTGCLYIDTLVDMLNSYHRGMDLVSILTRVNDEVSKRDIVYQGMRVKQMPQKVSTLRRRLLFM